MSPLNCKQDHTAHLAAATHQLSGRRFWRSVEELADSAAVQAWVEREFPAGAAVWGDHLSRRKFLSLMAASLALAGVAGCSVEPAPEEQIVPYVRPPESVVPGRPLFFATTMCAAGEAVGLLVESHMGRPIKVEGNPSHPASLGATDALHQSSVLSLYDPDRSQAVTQNGEERTWEAAIRAIRAALAEPGAGQRVRILTPTVRSQTLAAQLQEVIEQFPGARWCTFDPVSREHEYAGAERAIGRRAATVYDFSQADVILSLDCDFLTAVPGHLHYARQFAARRRFFEQGHTAERAMNRLYVVEAAVSCTGAKADHRLALRNADIPALARSLAARLGAGDAGTPRSSHERWINAVAADLESVRGRSLIVVGHRQPAAIHALVAALNQRLGNLGTTRNFVDPVELTSQAEPLSLAELTAEMQSGDVELLLILGGNPVYTAPADVRFAEALRRVPLSVHLNLYQDETSQLTTWHLPEAHYLEAWSDARAYDGTASLVQPLVKPLYEGRTAHEVLAALLTGRATPGREIVKRHWLRYWSERNSAGHFDDFWQTSLHDGVIQGTAFSPIDVELSASLDFNALGGELEKQAARPASEVLELNLLSDPTIGDGSFANNGWLQELPKPITLLTWGNAAIVSPATAERLGLSPGTYVHGGQHGGHYMPLVELAIGKRRVRGPLWIMPGHADDTVTVYLGGGRTHAGHVGSGVGLNAYPLRTTEQPWFATGAKLTQLDATEIVACTQVHHSMEGRDLVRVATFDEFAKNPRATQEQHLEEQRDKYPRADEPLSFYPDVDLTAAEQQWGMSIDLTSCIGCNACIAACQAENNIPVVGKEQVAFGREMHWLRVDRYLEGPAESPTSFHFQPLPCMHCENAPCEYVCPVEATVHSADGLNDMIYNRCVGTRFCSNNCPYKVRRFNYLAYSNFEPDQRNLQYNPDVTVRSRGVMEKCTYCVQRIRQAQIDAENEQRPIRDGEILTACQAVCPTEAIVFGDLKNRDSELNRRRASPLHYGLLEELNTRPRTTYLAELRNPNPQMEAEA